MKALLAGILRLESWAQNQYNSVSSIPRSDTDYAQGYLQGVMDVRTIVEDSVDYDDE